jgi:hypothetical protein
VEKSLAMCVQGIRAQDRDVSKLEDDNATLQAKLSKAYVNQINPHLDEIVNARIGICGLAIWAPQVDLMHLPGIAQNR